MTTEIASPETAAREFEAQSTLERIVEKTTGDGSADIKFLKKENLTDTERQTNEVFSNLMQTIEDISKTAAEKSLGEDIPDKYLYVLKEMYHVSNVMRSFVDGKLPLRRDFNEESYRKGQGDTIYSYKGWEIELDDQVYDVKLLIRPNGYWDRSGGSGQTRSGAEQRMRFDITPRHSEDSSVSIRIDPGERVVYDVVTKGIENVDLGNAGQVRGHHFPSQMEMTSTSFAQVLETINDNLQAAN